MASEATPRINAKYLESFTNQTVRILGKVVSLRGDTATIDANGTVNIHLNRDAHLSLNNAVEVVGKVQSDLSVKVYQATDFGSDMGTVASSKQHGLGGVANTLRKSDYNAVEAVVDATHRYKEIFYDSND